MTFFFLKKKEMTFQKKSKKKNPKVGWMSVSLSHTFAAGRRGDSPTLPQSLAHDLELYFEEAACLGRSFLGASA